MRPRLLFLLLLIAWLSPGVAAVGQTGPGATSAAGVTGSPDLRCGAYCLYVSLKGLKFPTTSLEEILSKLGPASPAGYSFAELETCAKSYGAKTLGVSTSIENLQRRSRPFAVIARLKSGHFVNIVDVEGGTAKLIDPPHIKTIPVPTLESQWDRTALLISQEPLESEETLTPRRSWQLAALGGILAICSVGMVWWGYGRKRATIQQTSLPPRA